MCLTPLYKVLQILIDTLKKHSYRIRLDNRTITGPLPLTPKTPEIEYQEALGHLTPLNSFQNCHISARTRKVIKPPEGKCGLEIFQPLRVILEPLFNFKSWIISKKTFSYTLKKAILQFKHFCSFILPTGFPPIREIRDNFENFFQSRKSGKKLGVFSQNQEKSFLNQGKFLTVGR